MARRPRRWRAGGTRRLCRLHLFLSVALPIHVVAGCAARARPSEQELAADREAAMTRHDWWARRARNAIVAGDLAGVRVPGSWLATHELQAAFPEGSEPDVEALERLGAEFERVGDLDEAGVLLGRIADACGDCHLDHGGPRFAEVVAPAGHETLQGRMRRHAWAEERLWEGLVGPSEDAWHAGAMVLCENPFTPERMPSALDRPELIELAQRLHEDGVEALVSERRTDRAEVYGRLIATCAACHGLSEGGPGL